MASGGSGCLRIGAVVKSLLNLAKASTDALFHASCLESFLKSDMRGLELEQNNLINLL